MEGNAVQMERANEAVNAVSSATENKYLTFALADEEFGIGILKVKEIIGMMDITPVPRTPEFVLGVINLRGKVIPVVDLRLKFGLPYKEPDERTCVIVVEVIEENEKVQMGIVVDSVSEVINIGDEDIEDAPSFGDPTIDTQYITGMAKAGDEVKILMDINKVLTGEGLKNLGF